MKFQLVLMVALGVVIPTAMSVNQHCTNNAEWQAYKVKFEKQYSSNAEESRRCMIWQQNYDEVQRHNADQTQTYKKAVNHFADQTLEERKRSRGLVLPQGLEKLSAPIGKKLVTPPASFDWRSFNAVASVKNQKSCGSCWSFSVTGVMESQYFFKTNKLVSFSQQQLIDCDTYDSGCNGGWPANTLVYIKNTGGLETLTDYPYLAKQQSKCKYNKTLALKMKVTGIYTVSDTSALTDATIQSWIYNYGPLGVAVCASQSGFDTYSSGVYKGAEVCVDIDHAVLLVGYVNNGTSCYYILKNSWGTTWGMNGYMNIACGSNKLVQHPTVATITV